MGYVTMHFYKILENKLFIGRKRELTLLREINATKAAAIIVVAGRRRIGKTELIEQFFRGNRGQKRLTHARRGSV